METQNNKLTVGIVGLGPIGGSMARAYSADAPRLTALLREGRIAKENADKDTE